MSGVGGQVSVAGVGVGGQVSVAGVGVGGQVSVAGVSVSRQVSVAGGSVGGQVSDGARDEGGAGSTRSERCWRAGVGRSAGGARGDGSGRHPDPTAPQPIRQRRGRGPRTAAVEVPAGGAGGGEGSEGEDQQTVLHSQSDGRRLPAHHLSSATPLAHTPGSVQVGQREGLKAHSQGARPTVRVKGPQ